MLVLSQIFSVHAHTDAHFCSSQVSSHFHSKHIVIDFYATFGGLFNYWPGISGGDLFLKLFAESVYHGLLQLIADTCIGTFTLGLICVVFPQVFWKLDEKT